MAVCVNEKSAAESILIKKDPAVKGFSLFNIQENERWNNYWSKNMERERNAKENLKIRSKVMGITEHPLS